MPLRSLSNGVRQTDGIRSSPSVGQPIVVHALEGVRLSIEGVQQVPRSEAKREVVSNSLREVEVQLRRRPLVNVGRASLCDQEQLFSLHVECHCSVEARAVTLEVDHAVDDVRALTKQRTCVRVIGVCGPNDSQFLVPNAGLRFDEGHVSGEAEVVQGRGEVAQLLSPFKL